MKRLAAPLLFVLIVAAGCSTADLPSTRVGDPGSEVGRFASANPGSVSTYWLRAPQGLVIVDTQRSLTDARAALAAAESTGSPIAAVLITHAHPDHVGGVGVFHQAAPNVPVYASQPVDVAMRTDPLHFYDITRALPNSDYAPEITYPDHTFAPGAAIEAGGLQLQTAEFGPGETETATTYYDPGTHLRFDGHSAVYRLAVDQQLTDVGAVVDPILGEHVRRQALVAAQRMSAALSQEHGVAGIEPDRGAAFGRDEQAAAVQDHMEAGAGDSRESHAPRRAGVGAGEHRCTGSQRSEGVTEYIHSLPHRISKTLGQKCERISHSIAVPANLTLLAFH
ncbi:hypothetical protein ABIA39_007037 [Nocardia sp. GAS34]